MSKDFHYSLIKFFFSETTMTEEDYKQAEESFSGPCMRQTSQRDWFQSKQNYKQCYDLLLTEMVASGDSRGIYWDNLYFQKRTASSGGISKTSNWFFLCNVSSVSLLQTRLVYHHMQCIFFLKIHTLSQGPFEISCVCSYTACESFKIW